MVGVDGGRRKIKMDGDGDDGDGSDSDGYHQIL